MPAPDPTSAAEVDRRLAAPDLPALFARLGLTEEDQRDAGALLDRVRRDPAASSLVGRLADQLAAGVGRFPGVEGPDPWAGYDEAADPYGRGALPLLALVLTAPGLERFHAERQIPGDVSRRTLTELGQQVWVHRRTFGGFGLHTWSWLWVTWSGSLYWLGRLQFNLQWQDDEWVVSTHIPQIGPLEPAAVDDAFARAQELFGRCFPDRPVRTFWCSSWLLDPTLVAGLPEGSNMARFGRRWRLYGEPMPGDGDALFFTFARRGDVDLATLPRETTLQRLIVERLESGGHWQVCQGRIPWTGTDTGSGVTEEGR